MATIRLTKEFSFEAAHALDGYDGPCREIHGHSYRLFVTVKGRPSTTEGDPKCGMVLDFGVLKRIVHEEIVARFDHAFRAAPLGGERVTGRDARPTLRQHRAGRLPAHVREHARRFRAAHPPPAARGGRAPCAPPARDGDLVRRVVRRGQRLIRRPVRARGGPWLRAGMRRSRAGAGRIGAQRRKRRNFIR